MPKSDDDAAMSAVLDGMGKAAREFKAKRYAPKSKPGAESESQAAPDEDSGDSAMPSVDELAAMLGNGG